MSLDNVGVVDRLGIEKATGAVLLVLLDDSDWANEPEHLYKLQQKLNRYLDFIESREVFQEVKSKLGRDDCGQLPVKVSILAKHPVPESALTFLRYATGMFSAAGYSLTHRVVNET